MLHYAFKLLTAPITSIVSFANRPLQQVLSTVAMQKIEDTRKVLSTAGQIEEETQTDVEADAGWDHTPETSDDDETPSLPGDKQLHTEVVALQAIVIPQ